MSSTGSLAESVRTTSWQWALLAAALVALPLGNAFVGFPYLRANIPGNGDAWFVHRGALVSVHILLVALVVVWARTTRFDLGARTYLWVGIASIAACVLVAAVVASQKELVPLTQVQDGGVFSRPAQVVSIASILWAGVGQEVLFRAFAVPVVANLTGSTTLAVFVTSAAFAFYHGGISQGAVSLGANFAGGLLLGLLFVHTGSLWAAAVPHAILITMLLALA